MAKLKAMLKNQKGLTLIELLVVVVVLGIISAIAVPSVGGIIDNSKKDAHVGNAQAMINAAKLYVTGNPELEDDGYLDTNDQLTLQDLYDLNLLETMDDPDGGTYEADNSYVEITGTDSYSYSVYLTNSTIEIGTSNEPVSESELDRSQVSELDPE